MTVPQSHFDLKTLHVWQNKGAGKAMIYVARYFIKLLEDCGGDLGRVLSTAKELLAKQEAAVAPLRQRVAKLQEERDRLDKLVKKLK